MERRVHYGADGIYAIRVPTGRIRTNHPLETRMRSGNWTAAIGRPFGATAGGLAVLPAESEGSHRVGTDEDTVTYALDDLQDLADVDLSISAPDPSHEDVTVLNETGARMVIDRNTVTVRRFAVRSRFRETSDPEEPRTVRQRTTLVITDVGTVAVDRPGSLTGPGSLEVLRDVVFYA